MVIYPTLIQQIGDQLVVVWSDGHESYYSPEALRRACPCANCAGEGDLFGRISKGPESRYVPASFQLISAEQTGNYGVQFNFADGHNWGIWTFERLRSYCDCGHCGAVALK